MSWKQKNPALKLLLADSELHNSILREADWGNLLIERWQREHNTVWPHRSLGYRLPVHGLLATILHQLGIQYDAFRVTFQGLGTRLTGVECGTRVLKEVLA